MLKPVLAGVCLSIAALTATAAHARELTGQQISGLVSGAVVEIDTPTGTKIPVRYTSEGRLAGEARELAWYLGSERDTGRWWVANDQLCHKWLRWFGGDPQCMKISREGQAFRWLAKDGSSGTASIAVPPASIQAAAAMPNFGSAFTKRAAPAAETKDRPPPASLAALPRSEPSEIDAAPAPLAAPAPSPSPAPAAVEEPAAQETAAASASAATLPGITVIVPPQPKPVDRSALAKASPTPAAASIAPSPVAAAPPPAASAPPPPAASATDAPPAKQADSKSPPQAPLFKVANVRSDDVLNVRSGPSADHDIVGMLAPSSRGIAITSDCRSQWCPVRLDGTAGWVNSAFLTPEVVAALSARTEPPPSALRDSPEAPRACLTPAARALLGRIEQTFGAVQVISTCRSGAIIAGTNHPSRHASGNAIDFKAGARKPEIVAWLIENHRTGGIMTYAGMDHIHVDIGPRFISLAGGRHWSSWRRGRSE